jgi:putative ABC transport system permease protein
VIAKVFDNVRIAYVGLVSNKLRTALTMLGITIGIAAVIILVSVGQAVETFVNDQFSSIGSNLIVVFGAVPGANTDGEPLTASDVIALSDSFRVPDVRNVAPNVAVAASAVYEGKEVEAQIAGVTQSYFEVLNTEVLLGREITSEDQAVASRIALVDERGAEQLFNNEYPIGKRIRIGGVTFQVEGVLENFGGPGGGQAIPQIFVPLTAAQRYLGGTQTLTGEYAITSIFMEGLSEERTNAAIDEITAVLREEHKLKDDDEDDFQIITQSAILESLSTITGLLTVFLAVIAGISLLVGGIGIMNIMLVTVTERTKEIGLRKAVGAQRLDILLQFLVESVTLSLLGGVIGTAIAASMAFLVSAVVPDLQVSIQVSSIILVTAICVGIGMFFGAYPANRAAGLNPIDALRYE